MADKSGKKSLPMFWGEHSLRSTRSGRKTAPDKIAAPDESAPEDEAPGDAALPCEIVDVMRSVMQELADKIHTSLDSKLESVVDRVGQLFSNVQEANARMDTFDGRLEDMELSLTAARQQVDRLERAQKQLGEKLDNIENRGRRNNLRVVGLPEKMEGADPVGFLARWIPELLHMECKNGRLKIDRAHRALAPEPPPNGRPRAIILRVHHFGDKTRILNASRNLQDLSYQGHKIFFFQDFSIEVQRKRQSFAAVKRDLRQRGLSYALLYPARLRVQHAGAITIYTDPKAVEQFLQQLGRRDNPDHGNA